MNQFQYVPLKKSGKTLLLDTDIGPDCDDAGAIAVMAYLAKRYNVSVGAVVSCTSSPFGAPCAEALCSFAGLEVGVFAENKQPYLLTQPEFRKYDRFIAEQFGKKRNYTESTEAYRRTLAALPDGGAVIVAIGPFSTLAQLLISQPDEISPLSGRELLGRKVYAVVVMAGKYPRGREWNLSVDPISANLFLNECPVPLIFSDFDVGYSVRCGFPTPPADAINNPFWQAYRRFCGAENDKPQLNAGFDLTAVHFAFEGESEWFELSEPEMFEVREDGSNSFFQSADGDCRRIVKRASDEALAAVYNQILFEVGHPTAGQAVKYGT